MPSTIVNLSDITGALPAIYREPTVRTFNARSQLMRLLPVVPGRGKNVTWDVEGTGANGENYAEGADVSNYGSDAVGTPVLSWGLYRSNFGVSDLARDAAGSSMSPADLAQLLGRQYLNSVRKLAATLNEELFDGAGTGTLIEGLDDALQSANTYAGIDRSAGAGAYFRANVFDPGVSTAPTLRAIRKDLSDIYDACGERPDLAFCTSAVWQKIASLFDNVKQYPIPTAIQTARGEVSFDASVSRIMVDGCTFIADKDATSSAIYYLNSNYVRVEYLPSVQADLLPEVTRDVVADDGYGEIPLGMKLKALSVAGASQKYTLQATLQLVVAKPSACGKRLNVSTT